MDEQINQRWNSYMHKWNLQFIACVVPHSKPVVYFTLSNGPYNSISSSCRGLQLTQVLHTKSEFLTSIHPIRNLINLFLLAMFAFLMEVNEQEMIFYFKKIFLFQFVSCSFLSSSKTTFINQMTVSLKCIYLH